MVISSHQDQYLFHGQHFSYTVYTSLNSDYIQVCILQMNNKKKNCVYVDEYSPEHLCHTNACVHFK